MYVSEKQAYENLANAIIVSAAEDYEFALHRLERNPNSVSARNAVMRGEDFFYSDWFLVLSNYDPATLIRKIKEKVKRQSE